MACLIAGGDSFTFGSELQGCYDKNRIEVASPNSYTSLIANEAKLDYQCVAFPGYSNDAISRTVIDTCNITQNIKLVIVCWTFPGRYEFLFNDEIEQISVWNTLTSEREIKSQFKYQNDIVLQHHIDKFNRDEERGLNGFARTFFGHVGSSKLYETYNYLSNIVNLQNYLKLNNISYLFLSVDQSIEECKYWCSKDSNKRLLNQIDFSNWFWFPGDLGFYTWSLENKFPFGTTHPLEPAHSEAAELIYEHLRTIGRLS